MMQAASSSQMSSATWPFESSQCYERFMTKQQFADLLQVSQRTIDRWLTNGDLPPESRLVIGGCVRFRPLALAEWIRSDQQGHGH